MVQISIHALREEGDQGNTAALSVTTIFLSTPSARRATNNKSVLFEALCISIHALREEGDSVGPERQCVDCISIHALREEGDERPYQNTTGAN